MGKATIINAGFYASIQDRGRYDHRDIGVPISGAMDQNASSKVNQLLDNHPDDAVLETVLSGVTLLFSKPTYIAVTGMTLSINDEQVTSEKPHKIDLGDIITIGESITGNYGYVGIKGGFQSEMVLGSRSMMKGITAQHKLEKSDQIHYTSHEDAPKAINSIEKLENSSHLVLKAFPGPEWNRLNRHTQELLLTTTFQLSTQCNRMAFRSLCSVTNPLKSIHSSPVLPGTVQWTPDGELLILMRDAQTTGGYPRIFQLTENSVNKLSQLDQSSEFSFVII